MKTNALHAAGNRSVEPSSAKALAMKALATMAVLAALTSAALASADQEELIWQDGQWVAMPKPAMGTAAGEISLLRKLIDQKDYAGAIDFAQAFLKRWPGEPLREDAFNLAGEAELRRGHYFQAFEWYEKQLAEFPNGPLVNRALDRQMQAGRAFLEGKKRLVAKILWLPAVDDGIEILHKVAEHAPGTLRAQTALLMIADFYFDKVRWQEAADAYEQYLKLFPSAEHSTYAEYRAADSLRRSYRGPLHDDANLIEAEQRFKAYVEHHPSSARELRVEQVLRGIRESRAEKLFVTARFYQRTGYEDSALFYYRDVADNYPDTSWGRQAAGMAGKLAPGKAPPVPPGTPPIGPVTQPSGGLPATAPATRSAAAAGKEGSR